MKENIGLIIIALFFVAAIVCCCLPHEFGEEERTVCGYIVVRRIGNGQRLCRDPETGICYVVITDGAMRVTAINPYYVVVNGEPEIAVYGVNFAP